MVMAALLGWRAFVSQSHPVESDNRGEVDPLLAFSAELSAIEFP